MCCSMISIFSTCPHYPETTHYFQTSANKIHTKKICEFCAKDFNYLARDPFLIIMRVENFKEHWNQISLSSERSFHGFDTLYTGCLKCFKLENIANLL